MKSLLLLSSLFCVSLDILIKGDLEEMKEKIKTEDVIGFKHDGNIFSILLIGTILLPVPLVRFFTYVGAIIWGVLAITTIYYAYRVENHKKKFDIQTYREIVGFIEGKSMDEVEKNREYGKRPYQKFLLALCSGLVTLIVVVIMFLIFYVKW